MRAIDFHTHAFPDDLAPRAIAQIEARTGVTARLDGTVSALLRSMDSAGIERAVVASIATRPTQGLRILEWSDAIRSERLIPFPSVHPDDPDVLARIGEIRDRGFAGVKMHPYYQSFSLDEPRLQPIYERIRDRGLLLLCHTGFDVGFPRERRADPARLARVLDRVPGLRFVATHLGAWEDWDEVERYLVGKPVYIECSFAMPYLKAEQAKRLLLAHPADRILFGTDSPWADQSEALAQARSFGLPEDRARAFFRDTACRLLDGAPRGRE